MANGAVNFFLDATDDPLLPDGIPSFDGGMFSNVRANLLQPNQSVHLVNCDIDKLGKIRTRRGTMLLGTGPPDGVGVRVPPLPIQGLTSYQTVADNYIVAAYNGQLWKYNGDTLNTWTLIGTGGVSDNDQVLIYRTGQIDQSTVPTGYKMGTTVLTVDSITGVVGKGEKLYFTNNLRTNWYEYTIADQNGVVGVSPTTQITLEEPGLVFDVKDKWKFVVARPALINHPANYPGADAGPLVIDNYGVTDTVVTGGTPNVGEYFVIKSENRRHKVGAGSTATSLVIDPAGPNPTLQVDFATGPNTAIHFAQGNDLLYFCDGAGDIYAWNGKTTMRIEQMSILDFSTGSTLHQKSTMPPTACSVLLWFQNRLIASGIDAEPDAIYFSDFFDGTSWDTNYQKIRVGGGDSDPITGLTAWTDYNLIVWKKNSIYVINLDPNQNPNPDDPTLLVASYSVKQIHKRIGCPAPLSAVQVGGGSTTPGSDVFFVDGDKKLHSIRRVLAAETQQEVGAALSLPVQDVFDQINLGYIHRCSAMYHNEHYIVGIPSTRRTNSTWPNVCMVYNSLTQSWCGLWRWKPTCFSIRTDTGLYCKLIFGDVDGNVVQWEDDLALDDETDTSYQDKVTGGSGVAIATSITTRAITFGDYYSFKTGLNVEFEFDQSEADDVVVSVGLDGIGKEQLSPPFDTLTEVRVTLGVSGPHGTTLPFTLPESPGLLRKAFDLQRYGTWREIQFQMDTEEGKLSVRSIRLTGFMDTIRLQTVPVAGVPSLGIPSHPLGGP